MKLNSTLLRTCWIVFFVVVLVTPLSALANLQVFPLRIVLSEKARTAQIAVRHRGNQAMRYRIAAVFYRMKRDGAMELVEVPKPEEKPASAYFTYSPRQVTLQPNVEQIVRVLMRAPPDLAEGEYRAHLHFEGIDEEEDKKAPGTVTEGAQMMIKARMAVAIPVIVRKGEPSAKVSFANLKLLKTPDQKLAFAVEMSKEGNANVYGDIEITHTPKGETSSNVVGNVNGLSSYIEKRIVSFPLAVDQLGSGTLRLEMKRPVADGGEVIATTQTEIN